ncbi:DNA-binding response regulator [Comamonas serinivorans]|uniref:DNA-binding response regulator n=1 Tax=Comamonas serinivorans TaxID=1082851 RepID=A0A1Y0ETS9_9BURK|nr:response regulator transcription factor [Comamonas serinivorans]ARU06986.1 DNA-binding response regulator [Comamonas serinivorans]
MHRILIVEDDVINAQYLSNGLRQQGADVVLCRDGVQGLALAVGQGWDVIVLDRMLPNDFDGLKIVQALRATGSTTPVLILSALSAIDERVAGLNAGGDDYLTKPFAFTELSARIDALLRRSQTAPSGYRLEVADLRVDLMARKAERAGQALALQPREFRLLSFLMQHADRVVTRTMLLEAVWNYHFDPETNVIDVHMSRLRAKVDKGFSPALIHTVRGIGYSLTSNPDALP